MSEKAGQAERKTEEGKKRKGGCAEKVEERVSFPHKCRPRLNQSPGRAVKFFFFDNNIVCFFFFVRFSQPISLLKSPWVSPDEQQVFLHFFCLVVLVMT